MGLQRLRQDRRATQVGGSGTVIGLRLARDRLCVSPGLTAMGEKLPLFRLRKRAQELLWTERVTDVLEPGDKVGAYEVLEQIGSGAMGVVYRVRHGLIGRIAALKMLADDVAYCPAAIERFFVEARAANQVRHPGVIEVTDFVQSSDAGNYLIMEILDGQSLEDHLDERGRVEIDFLIELGMQAASAMAAVHRAGVIHRDLKPGNVFLARGAEGALQVKILDFGVAHLREEDGPGEEGESPFAVGTPLYIPPEQAGGSEADERSDVYSLGALLYHAATGRPLFEHEVVRDLLVAHIMEPVVPPSRLCPPVVLPPSLEALLLQCVAKDPADRPASMDELVRRLGAIRDEIAWRAAQALDAELLEASRISSRPRARLARAVMAVAAPAIVAALALTQLASAPVDAALVTALVPGPEAREQALRVAAYESARLPVTDAFAATGPAQESEPRPLRVERERRARRASAEPRRRQLSRAVERAVERNDVLDPFTL